MHGDLRVLGAGLDAQVAARAGGVQVVAREVRQVLQRLGAAALEAEAGEQPGAEAEGDRQPGRRQPDRLAGVVGRNVCRALGGPHRAGPLAARHPLGRLGPRLQQGDQLVAGVGPARRTPRSAAGPGPG